MRKPEYDSDPGDESRDDEEVRREFVRILNHNYTLTERLGLQVWADQLCEIAGVE